MGETEDSVKDASQNRNSTLWLIAMFFGSALFLIVFWSMCWTMHCCLSPPREIKYSPVVRVFLHSPHYASFFVQDGSELKNITSGGGTLKILLDAPSSNSMWAVYNTGTRETVIHIHNPSQIEGGRQHVGKNGSGWYSYTTVVE